MLNDADIWCLSIYGWDRRKSQTGMKPFFWFSARTVGGADGSAGEDAAGAGHHQAASVLHPAVAAREGPTPEQPSPGQTQAASGDSGDEVSRGLTTFRFEWLLIPFLFEIAPFLLRRDEFDCRNKRGPFCFATEFSLSSFGGCSSFCHGTAFL